MIKSRILLGVVIVISMLMGCSDNAGLSPSAPYATLLPITPLTPIPPSEQVSPEITLTPYATIFKGFFNCRAEPNTSSPMLVILQGQQITIIAQNLNRTWLYVTVQNFDKPCWVAMAEIPNLDYNAISLIPILGVIPTFTLPAEYITPTTNGGGGSNTSNSTSTPPTPSTLTPITPPTPTFTPSLTPCWKPSAPSNLGYKPSNGNNFILSWSAASGATGYRVHRSGGGVSDTTGNSVTVEVKNNQSFTFFITAINKCGESEASNSVTISR